MQGFYKIEARSPDGNTKVLADWFPNIITDIGLNRWGSGGIITYCRVGTGTSAPSASNDSLEIHHASTSTVSTQNKTSQVSSPYYHTLSISFAFAQGAVVGNMSEIGVGWTATGSGLFSRARIKDSGGSDTTITVGSIDQLIVTYQLRINVPETDIVSTVTIGGVSRTVTMRAANATSSSWFGANSASITFSYSLYSTVFNNSAQCYSGPIVSINSMPSSSLSGGASVSYNAPYVNNSLQQDFKYSFHTSAANGTIQSLYIVSGGGLWQVEFSPAIVKDNTMTLEFIVRFSWNRV